MKILFILTSLGSWTDWHPGLASLASYLRQAGMGHIDLLEIRHPPVESSVPGILARHPDVIAVTSNSHQFPHVRALLSTIKAQAPAICTVIGGVHPTIAPECAQDMPFADALCRGEGEEPLRLLLERWGQGATDLAGLPNLATPPVIPNPTYQVDDLDQLPFPARDLFEVYRQPQADTRLIPRFIFCRGCPFDCTYCCNHILRQCHPSPKTYVRWPSPARAIEELVRTAKDYAFSHYVIDDDIFTLRKDWVLGFCEAYPDTLTRRLSFETNIRVGTTDREMLAALRRIGCRMVKIGLESGDEELRKTVLNRHISNEQTIATAAMAREVGLAIHTFNMVGIPGESRSAFLRTIRLNRRIRPNKAQITIFYPYPGTRMGEYCATHGMIRATADSYFNDSVLRHDRLFRWEIKLYAAAFRPVVAAASSWREAMRHVPDALRLLLANTFITKMAKGLRRHVANVRKSIQCVS